MKFWGFKHKDEAGTETVYDLAVKAENVKTNAEKQFVTAAEKEKWNKKQDATGSAKDMTVAFTQAASRTNLVSGEKLSVSLGKVSRFFADLKEVAFSGKYGDLSGTPTLGGAAAMGVADNDTTNNKNFLPTARIVYEHGQEIDQLSSNMGGLSFYEDETGKYVVGADNIPTPLSKRARLILRVSSKSTDTNNTQSGTVIFDNTDLRYKYVTKDGVKTEIEAKELTFTYSRHIPINDNSAVASISLIFSDD